MIGLGDDLVIDAARSNGLGGLNGLNGLCGFKVRERWANVTVRIP
jgi:hypothetical protein